MSLSCFLIFIIFNLKRFKEKNEIFFNFIFKHKINEIPHIMTELFYENTAQQMPQASDYETEEITWTIDRTPNPNYLNEILNEEIYNTRFLRNITNIYDIEPTIRFDEKQQNIIVICEEFEISDEELDCCICMETKDKNEICSLNCKHKFCGECVETCVKKPGIYTCSLCREDVTIITAQKNQIKEKINQYCSLKFTCSISNYIP
jgi:hypothetical protein